MAQLLQTIDSDGDQTNGIKIENVYLSLDLVQTSPGDLNFEVDIQMALGHIILVDKETAKLHLDATIADMLALGPEHLAAFYQGSTSDDLLVFAKATAGATTYRLYTSTDGINFKNSETTPEFVSDSGVVFDYLAPEDVYFRMTAMVNGTETAASNTIFISNTNRPTDKAITLQTPSASDVTLAATPTFEWAAHPEAASYIILVEPNAIDAPITDHALVKVGGSPWQYGTGGANLLAEYIMPALKSGNSYGIAVIAIAANGTTLAFSENIDFWVGESDGGGSVTLQ